MLGTCKVMDGRYLIIFTAAALFGLSGCGGGGGGGGGNTSNDTSGSTTYDGSIVTATINGGNAGDVAGATADSASATSGTADSGSTFTGVKGENAQTADSLLGAAQKARELAMGRAAENGGLIAGATTTTKQCDNGSYDITRTDPNGDGVNVAGDSASITFNSCEFIANGTTTLFQGSFNVDVTGGDTRTDHYDQVLSFGDFLIAADGTALFGANGPMRVQSGSEAGSFPTGHTVQTGGNVDMEMNVGANGTPLEVVDNVNDNGFRLTNVNYFYADTNGGDGILDTSGTWYMAMHGNGSDSSNNTMEMCNEKIDGCVVVDHGVTTQFRFEANGVPYPVDGVVQYNGAGGSYVKLDAGITGDPTTVQLTINDGTSTTTKTVKWSDISDGNFSQ